MPLSLQTFPTVPEAAAALKAGGARYVGGGTLVVRASNEGDIGLDSFVRSTDAGLRRIEVAGGKATLGASVTIAPSIWMRRRPASVERTKVSRLRSPSLAARTTSVPPPR